MTSLPVLQYPDRRPRTRGECATMPRPCPFVSCRYHLAHDWATPKHGPKPTDEELVERIANACDTCTLDVADRGENLPQDVGKTLGVTRQRVRQIIESVPGSVSVTVREDTADTLAALDRAE